MATNAKASDIGLGQGYRVCQMRPDKRLAFFAEGLPILLESAQSLFQAAEALEKFSREAQILERHASEEAAKILILLDIVRCPVKLVPRKAGFMMGWFYNHLTRLIYEKTQGLRPTTLQELQSYIDLERKSHSVEGDFGETILPNWETYLREGTLYADIILGDDNEVSWHSPRQTDPLFGRIEPDCLRIATALAALGAFTVPGLKIMHDVWSKVDFIGELDLGVKEALTLDMLKKFEASGLITDQAMQEHVDMVWYWQIPMYHMDFRIIPVTQEDLEAEQRAIYRSQVDGYW